jgi:hypothetical protein
VLSGVTLPFIAVVIAVVNIERFGLIALVFRFFRRGAWIVFWHTPIIAKDGGESEHLADLFFARVYPPTLPLRANG